MKSEEMAELLAEKARVAEEESTLLQRKAAEFEDEIRRLKKAASKVILVCVEKEKKFNPMLISSLHTK